MKGRLIVSCQALPEEPLHSSYIMGRMAAAAKEGGAAGIRANTKEDITEIKKNVDLPIIGIVKRDYADSEVYITPTMREIEELMAVGPEIIALDATSSLRPQGKTLEEFYQEVRSAYPSQLLMADCSTVMVEDIHIFQIHTLQALVQARQQVFFASKIPVRSFPHIITGLCTNHQFISVYPKVFCQYPAKIFFRTARYRTIIVSKVKMCYAMVKRCPA